MPGKFENKSFAQVNLNDSFFDSLKQDYPQFTEWFLRRVEENRPVLAFTDEDGLGAFIALKEECEEIFLKEQVLSKAWRLKISTLRLAERFRGQRLGEGALGLILWKWQETKMDEVYVTVFPRHADLIEQLERFGFVNIGSNMGGERVYLRSKKCIDYSTPYKAFPFISPNLKKGGYLIIDEKYHDTLFPFSTLHNTIQEQLEMDAANGISKVYVGSPWRVHYKIGEPVFIYRKHGGETGKRYKSCVTSFCIVTDVITVKKRGKELLPFDEFRKGIGNKSVFSQDELLRRYQEEQNLTIIQLLYCGYFGSGNNVNMDWLDRNGLWSRPNEYPTDRQLSKEECITIWRQGGIDIHSVFGE